MSFKKFLAGILAVGMLATAVSALPVFGEDENAVIGEMGDVVLEAVPERITLSGTFVSFEENQMTILEGENETIINIDENTRVLSTEALPVEIESIEKDTVITVIADSAMTMSLPPQVYGYVILVGENAPLYGIVGEIAETEEGFSFTTTDNNYIFHAGAETEVAPYLTRNIIRAEDITKGSELLVYADLMTMSIPAQVPANKIVVLSLNIEETEETFETDMTKIVVNQNEVLLNIITETTAEGEEILMLPVRATAEAMGLEVNWDGTLKAITVGTVPMGINFNIGEDSYNKARMMPFTLGVAPMLVSEGEDSPFVLTYVPLTLFTEVIGAELEITEGVLHLSYNNQ